MDIGEISKKYFKNTFKPRREHYSKDAWKKLMQMEKDGHHPWGCENVGWENRPEPMTDEVWKEYINTIRVD